MSGGVGFAIGLGVSSRWRSWGGGAAWRGVLLVGDWLTDPPFKVECVVVPASGEDS